MTFFFAGDDMMTDCNVDWNSWLQFGWFKWWHDDSALIFPSDIFPGQIFLCKPIADFAVFFLSPKYMLPRYQLDPLMSEWMEQKPRVLICFCEVQDKFRPWSWSNGVSDGTIVDFTQWLVKILKSTNHQIRKQSNNFSKSLFSFYYNMHVKSCYCSSINFRFLHYKAFY